MGMPASTSGGLEDYTRDLTEMARNGQFWNRVDWPGSRNLADDSDFEPQNEK